MIPGFLMPQGAVRKQRTRGGKPIINIPSDMKRDFHKIDEDGNDIAYTPVDQNLALHNETLFQLRRYERSPTGVFMPGHKC